jgi:hypothetical protein
MINPNYLIGFIGITLVGMWYEKWRKSTEEHQQAEAYELVKQYLINDSSLANSKKPIIWIHVPREYNARHWLSFNSRMTKDVNRPYLYLTIKSVVDKCGESFNVCLINDESFGKIIPGWTIQLDDVAEPTRDRLRTLAMTRLLFYYGGVAVPASTLCFTDLKDTYVRGINNEGEAFIGEFLDRTSSADDYIYSPNTRMMGCRRGSKIMEEFDQYLMQLISRDYTAQPEFLGSCGDWWVSRVNARQATIIGADELGVQTPSGPMTVDMLLGSTYYNLSSKCVALYIPQDEISNRLNAQWFERQSPEQVLTGSYLLGTYFLVALANQ